MTRPITSSLNTGSLEALYAQYNRSEQIGNDPVKFLHRYEDLADREIAGLVASSLALGNVRQILRSVEAILECMGRSPTGFLRAASRKTLDAAFHAFRHRFIRGEDLVDLLWGLKRLMEEHGSLGDWFAEKRQVANLPHSILPALAAFVGELQRAGGGQPNRLLASPEKGSACKRMNLFLRWMIRRDHVDPGGWDRISPALLVIPLDTHIHRIARALGLTRRKQANLAAALETTEAFRRIVPDDPVRYDFALAHWSIDGGGDPRVFLR